MRDWYLWADSIPAQFQFPPAAGSSDTGAMLAGFEALRFRGNQQLPADRWSYVSDTESTRRYFDEGYALGYGLAVAGQDADPLPLRIRWVDPASPAATAGLLRGDVIETIQGRSAQSWKEARDFSPLVASRVGDELVLEVRGDAQLRRVVLQAVSYPITSVLSPREQEGWTSANGNRANYVFFKDFIDSAEQPLAAALLAAQQNQAKDLVLDLRYNGGGLVDFTAKVASSLAGPRLQGEVFTRLVYNNRHPEAEFIGRFADPQPLPALNLERLVLLSGARTCSASEMLLNGLKERHPGLEVRIIGERSCGKPYGFNPRSSCGLTYNAVNFMTVNARGEPSDASGMRPDCFVRDQYQDPLGSEREALFAAARQWLDRGSCPSAPLALGPSGSPASRPVESSGAPRPEGLKGAQRWPPPDPWIEEGEVPRGMFGRRRTP